MLWLYISAVVIVFGGSINAVLREIRADRLKLPVIEDEELLEESSCYSSDNTSKL
jgi:uncharacterized BrkB/YihY/UPF0761 family membrane protein